MKAKTSMNTQGSSNEEIENQKYSKASSGALHITSEEYFIKCRINKQQGKHYLLYLRKEKK